MKKYANILTKILNKNSKSKQYTVWFKIGLISLKMSRTEDILGVQKKW